ncbi:MAG: hypothetical protein II132_01905, partial [Desulfovibrio sp.]|nr:hypothetical protein [Desulfovibrio sp.]
MKQVLRRSESGADFTFREVVNDGDVVLSWDVPAGSTLPGGAFVVGDGSRSGVFFQGPETMTALSAFGARTVGLRINGFEKFGAARMPELSHLELAHSMMSHQGYRNYNFLMEAELAVLKDLGYQIDIRRFYGASVYGDNLGRIVNETPFYARRADGKGWLAGQPSEETFGIGLHVYGDYNKVVQNADILTRGEAAAGIRIDGAHTQLDVPSGVKIQSDGTEGAGLLVAYGKETEVAVRGAISARGEGGMAVRFDFGGNYMGDLLDMRGSYIHRIEDGDEKLADGALNGDDGYGFELFLDGPLVKSFDLAGSLEGKAAAIFMADNAFVKEINILAGASVKGDIVSLWDAKNRLLQAPKDSLYTSLVFGRRAGAGGRAGDADPDFNMTLEGSVTGPKGIDMSLQAGRLRVSGEVHVHNLDNFGWLDVMGLGSQQTGTVSGAFTQSDDGVLQSHVTPDGRSTYISAVKGSAGGRWAVTPDKGYWVHQKDVPVANAPVIFRDGTKTAFSSSLLAGSSSLTLSFNLLNPSGSRPVIGAVRADDAYSRHATRGSGAEAGRALSLANRGVPSSQMQALVTELDFMDSRAAIDRALSQLSADAFSESFAHALGRQQALGQRLLARMLSQLPKGTAEAGSRKAGASAPAGQTGLAAGDGTAASGRGWTVWGSLFGMADSQSAYGSSDGWYSTGCGLMGGADKALGDGLAAGFDLALVSDRFEAGVRLGSLATLQYAFTSHPDFEEDGAEALRTDGGTADSLGFLLGAHLGASKGIGSGCRLDADLMAGWRHE